MMKPESEHREARRHNPRPGYPCAVASAVVGCLLVGAAVVTVRSPSFGFGPSLRAEEGPKTRHISPNYYSEFSQALLVTDDNEDWVSFDPKFASKYFTEDEMKSLSLPGQKPTCDGVNIPNYCCIGAFSMAGVMVWDPESCNGRDYMRFMVPHAGHSLATYRDMGDVVAASPNRTISFVGDSIGAQHAYAMECSWLRSGKAKTQSIERIEYDNLFTKKGAFTRAGQYGTTALTIWRAATPEMYEQNLTTTVKFYLMYRPYQNMSEMQQIMDDSDTLVINFGLHWLKPHEDLYTAEMTILLTKLREFASTPGKTLVWRETSAQHFLNEGGEFPPGNAENFGMSKEEFEAVETKCHPLYFGPDVAPQWRDNIIWKLLKELGYTVHMLDYYDEDTKAHSTLCKQQAGVGEDGQATAPLRGGAAGKVAPVVYWMPFFRISSERLDLHPYNIFRKRMDCTHYCYTPYMYDPSIHQLATAIADTSRRTEAPCR